MMRTNKQVVMQVAVGTLALFLPMLSIQGASQSTAESKDHANKKVVAQTVQSHQDEGARIFEQNCARCHNAPDGFSSHISGTVLRHMRVRASLSKHDEEELLRFFNP